MTFPAKISDQKHAQSRYNSADWTILILSHANMDQPISEHKKLNQRSLLIFAKLSWTDSVFFMFF
jgi:hypothetical protein